MQSTTPSTSEDRSPNSSAVPQDSAWTLVQSYPYTDEAGALLYENCRYERVLPNGKREKKFLQRRPLGNGATTYNLKDVRRVVYRLDAVRECADQDVHVTEGEKDADNLASLGLCSTSIASPNAVDLDVFRDRHVYVHEDNDAAGRKKAKARATALSGIAASVRTVRYEDAGPGGDVSDWLAQGHGLEDLLTRCDEAGEFKPPKEKHANGHNQSNGSRSSLDTLSTSIKRGAPVARIALDRVCAEFRATKDGENRNGALNDAAFEMGQMGAHDWIDRETVFTALREAGGANGNGHFVERRVDAESTMLRAWQAGLDKPHKGLTDRPLNRSKSNGASLNETSTNGSAHNGAHVNGHDDAVEDGDNDPLPLYVRESRDDRFPIDELGDELAEAVRALQAATQTPIEMAANSVLGVISFACQAHGDIQLPIAAPPSPVSLFLLTIAGSGERKTGNDKIALKAVNVYQAELREEYRKAYAKYKNKHEIWKAARDKIIRDNNLSSDEKERQIKLLGPEPEPPLSPVLIFSDPTIQAIVKQFRDHQPSLGLFSSEGAVVLNGYSLGSDNKTNAAGILSELWDGKGISNIRVGDGEAINAGCRLTAHLAAQAMVAAKFLNDAELRDQGIISRFLVVDPESTMGTRFYKELAKCHQKALAEFEQNLLKILRRKLPIKEKTRNELIPPVLAMSDETRLAWIEFHNEVERKLAPGGEYEPIRGIAAKLPENAARLAACIGMYEHTAGGVNEPFTEVGLDSFIQGIELARFYARTALRLVDAEEPDRELTDAEKLLDWLKTTWIPGGEDRLVSLPDIVQFGPRWIRKSATAQQTMCVLEEHRHVEAVRAQVVRDKPRREVWRIA